MRSHEFFDSCFNIKNYDLTKDFLNKLLVIAIENCCWIVVEKLSFFKEPKRCSYINRSTYNYDYNCSSSIGPTSGSGARDRDYYEMGNRTASNMVFRYSNDSGVARENQANMIRGLSRDMFASGGNHSIRISNEPLQSPGNVRTNENIIDD